MNARSSRRVLTGRTTNGSDGSAAAQPTSRWSGCVLVGRLFTVILPLLGS
jgi:hypothetical protein